MGLIPNKEQLADWSEHCLSVKNQRFLPSQLEDSNLLTQEKTPLKDRGRFSLSLWAVEDSNL